jgi:flagellar biosynthesis regulator FlaF
MYQFAYSEICEELPPQSIPQPRRLSHALELIEAAQGVPSASHELLGVLSDFRKLWLMIVDDVSSSIHDKLDEAKPVPALADGILQEIERCRFHKLESAAPLGKMLQ